MKLIYLTFVFSLFFADVIAQNKPLKQSINYDRIQGPTTVDQIPTFPGGEKAYQKFLSRNLKWPSDSMDDTFGRVIISFMVEKNGRLSDFKVEKSLGKKFDAEALRVIMKSPKWIPGRSKGKAVKVRYSLPINFTIS